MWKLFLKQILSNNILKIGKIKCMILLLNFTVIINNFFNLKFKEVDNAPKDFIKAMKENPEFYGLTYDSYLIMKFDEK